MTRSVLQVFFAFLGSAGFALFFNIKRKNLLFASLNGAAAWAMYLILQNAGLGVFVCALAGSLVAAVASEVMARKLRAPSTAFYIPGIIPLVPGSSLYYMMASTVERSYDAAKNHGDILIWTMLGIGAGCGIVFGIIDAVRKIKSRNLWKKRKNTA